MNKMNTFHNAVAHAIETLRLDLEEMTQYYSESNSWVTTFRSKNEQSTLNSVRLHTTLRDGEYSVGIICPYPEEHRHTLSRLCIEIHNAMTGY